MAGPSGTQPGLAPRQRPATTLFQFPGEERETQHPATIGFGGYRNQQESDFDEQVPEDVPRRNRKNSEHRDEERLAMLPPIAEEAAKETQQLRNELNDRNQPVEALTIEKAEVRKALGSLKCPRMEDGESPERPQRG
ncbi:hypothetical protein LTR93_010763 [Exophiala xenobiotica]|nr:hypothetical protein LTR93_010763 [Exophiala xenobiotica]